MGSKTKKGIFLGYVPYPGGKRTRDYLVLDADSLQTADSVHNLRSLRDKDVLPPPHFTFPLKTGLLKQPEDPQDRSWYEEEEDDEDSKDSTESASDEPGTDVPVEILPQDIEKDFWSFQG